MANTIGTSTLSEVWRIKYAQRKLDIALKTAVVAEKICKVDRSGSKYIANPYLTALTATAAAIDGDYTVADFTSTDQALNITEQATSSTHLRDFEEKLSRADLFGSVVEEMTMQVVTTVDKYVLNYMCNNAGSSYTTPAGGFATSGNVVEIMATLQGLVAGYAEAYKGTFLVVENTDVTGLLQAGMSNGFSFADAHLNNGMVGQFAGVDIFVVRTGTFVTATIGTLSATNSGKRLFGVKNVHTYALNGVNYDEKKVTAKTGRELVVWADYGAAVWTQKAALLVAITLA